MLFITGSINIRQRNKNIFGNISFLLADADQYKNFEPFVSAISGLLKQRQDLKTYLYRGSHLQKEETES